jgi:hypothetical protein
MRAHLLVRARSPAHRPWPRFASCSLMLVLVLVALSAGAAPARAQGSAVTVLGVRSLDGEDQLERRVSQALRNSARSIDSFKVSEREMSLAQMSLAHGCEDVDAHCLSEIASTLSADRLLYGNLVHSGDKVRITLFNFNAANGQIESSAERSVLASQLVEPALGQIMTALVQRLAGKGGNGLGTLRVTGNRPGAKVAVDGKPAGELDASGELVISQVGEGAHAVSVATSDGRDRRELSVEVRADTTTTLRALLTPPLPQVTEVPPEEQAGPAQAPEDDKRRLKRILGWTSVGVAAGFAAATIYSWVKMLKISKDEDLNAYSELFGKPGEPGGTSDACTQAENGVVASRPMPPTTLEQVSLEKSAAKQCEQADKLEKLQYVFLGGTLVFAGVGTWLLVSSRKSTETSLSLTPSFAPQQASLRASLRF